MVRYVVMCVCVSPQGILLEAFVFVFDQLDSRGPGRIHRHLVNEAGAVSEDMEMGRHFHVPALLSRETEGNGSRRTVCVGSFPSVDPFLL